MQKRVGEVRVRCEEFRVEQYWADPDLPMWTLAMSPPPMGATVCPSASLLASFLLQAPNWVAGKTVLELGAGTGFLSAVALRGGARKVVATDLDNGELLQLCRSNLSLERADGEKTSWFVEALDWENLQQLDALLDQFQFDLVVATDVMYEVEHMTLVWNVLERIALRHNVNVLIANATRSNADFFQTDFVQDNRVTLLQEASCDGRQLGVYQVEI